MTKINPNETLKHLPRKLREEIYDEHPDFKGKKLTDHMKYCKFYWKFVQKQDVDFQIYVLNKLKDYKVKQQMKMDEFANIMQEVIHEANS